MVGVATEFLEGCTEGATEDEVLGFFEERLSDACSVEAHEEAYEGGKDGDKEGDRDGDHCGKGNHTDHDDEYYTCEEY